MNTFRIRGTILVTVFAVAAVGVAQDIRVMVNGDRVHFDRSQPMSMNGRVYVPLRGVFESMGAFVDWDPETRTVTAQRSNRDVKLTIGDRYAMVNGKSLFMDAPAIIRQGNTMVPLRFLSESLGADVQWASADRTVNISTSGIAFSDRGGVDNSIRSDVMIDKGTVIPVRLDQELSSNLSHAGDQFTATVRPNGTDYAGLPEGTKVEGRVVTAKPREGSQPGLLELRFTRVILPDGRRSAIDGALFGLDGNSVVRDDSGVYKAKQSKRDDRIVYAGYGAGAGLLVGLLTKKPLEGAILGGALGYLFGQVQKDQRKPNDVHLQRGDELGVRLDNDLTLAATRQR